MSITTELTRLTNAKAAIKTAIEGKGVTVPDATLLDGMAALIESIEAGGQAKIAFGSFTPADSCNYYEIEHNLGMIPTFALCFCEKIRSPSYEFLFDDGSSRICWFNSEGYISGTSNMGTSSLTKTTIGDPIMRMSSMFNAKENTICAGNDTATSNYFLSGVTYRWIVGVVAL